MKRLLIFTLLTAICITLLQAKTRKAVYVIVDGIPADRIEWLHAPAIFDIARNGGYSRAYTGGEIGSYSETATISAIGYTNLLTSTWFNKHNVHGNYDLKPNYNYWTIFRIAKEQPRPVKTAIYSSWLDNRTVLIGAGKPETGNLKIDFVADGFELDTINFKEKNDRPRMFAIDEHVSKLAAEGIRNDAPDLTWVYLQYTDDAGHIWGNGTSFDHSAMKADAQVARIWDAVKYREKNFNEDWMLVVTTDHGRANDGYDHGRQSERERTIWISTNVPVNAHFGTSELAITDIAPSICKFMGFEVPRDVLWEQDGISFYGKADVHGLKAEPYDNTIKLSWQNYTKAGPLSIYAAASNKFKDGEKDEWIHLADLPGGSDSYTVDLSTLPESKFYKFVIAGPDSHQNRWVFRR